MQEVQPFISQFLHLLVQQLKSVRPVSVASRHTFFSMTLKRIHEIAMYATVAAGILEAVPEAVKRDLLVLDLERFKRVLELGRIGGGVVAVLCLRHFGK